MVGDLITLPLRVWLSSAQFVGRAVAGATECAVSLAGHAIETLASGGADGATNYTPPPPAEEERPHVRDDRRTPEPTGERSDPRRELVEDGVPAREPGLERRATPREEPASPQVQRSPPGAVTSIESPDAEEPVHISEEPELVREEAERGAEEGASADVTVMEPWKGYAQMGASDVIDRIESASAAELAAVRLYESRHRRRQSVLAVADRQLKMINGSDRPT